MIIKSSLLAIAASLMLATLQPALAHDRDHDSNEVRQDVSRVQADRQSIARDEAALAHERSEANAARASVQREVNEGHLFRAYRDLGVARREDREVAAAARQLQTDRQHLQNDRRELHEDFEHRRGG